MMFGADDKFFRNEYEIIEYGRKTNEIGKVIFTKVGQNGLAGYYVVSAIPHQPTNELASPDSSRF
jgi:hypothetical protein